MALTLLTGGARSGKSVLAVRLATARPGPVTLIATAEPRDDEMRDKIALHRAARPQTWTTIEEPVEIEDSLAAVPGVDLVIVDCLTLWVSNAIERGIGGAEIAERAAGFAKQCAARSEPVLVVTNEVGDGIVPMDPATRTWRNLMGTVNAAVAAEATHAYLVVAGRAIPLGGTEEVLLT